METEYSYLPPEDMVVFDPNHPPFKDYNLIEDANSVANESFGDDAERAMRILNKYHMYAVACGCAQCMSDFIQVKQELYNQWRKPEGEMELVKKVPVSNGTV